MTGTPLKPTSTVPLLKPTSTVTLLKPTSASAEVVTFTRAIDRLEKERARRNSHKSNETQGQPSCPITAVIKLGTELQSFAGYLGLSTNVANALIDLDAPLPRTGISTELCPRISEEFFVSVSAFKKLGPPTDLARMLDKLIRRQQALNGAIHELETRPGSPPRLIVPHHVKSVEDWRKNSKLVLETLYDIDAFGGQHGIDLSTAESWPVLFAFVTEAVGGSHSCVQPDGEVVCPNWAISNSADPVTVTFTARLTAGLREEDVSVTSMSTGELTLEGSGPYETGQDVCLRLSTGTELIGTVRTAEGSRATVGFQSPL
jgi:hypothetical protein